MEAIRIPIHYLRVLFLEWGMDPDCHYRMKSQRHKGLVVNTDTGTAWFEGDQVNLYGVKLN